MELYMYVLIGVTLILGGIVVYIAWKKSDNNPNNDATANRLSKFLDIAMPKLKQVFTFWKSNK